MYGPEEGHVKLPGGGVPPCERVAFVEDETVRSRRRWSDARENWVPGPTCTRPGGLPGNFGPCSARPGFVSIEHVEAGEAGNVCK